MPLNNSEKVLLKKVTSEISGHWAKQTVHPAKGGYDTAVGPEMDVAPVFSIYGEGGQQNEIDRIIGEQNTRRERAVMGGAGAQQLKSERHRVILENPGLYKEISGMFDRGEPSEIVQAVVEDRKKKDEISSQKPADKRDDNKKERGGAGGTYTQAGMLETAGRGLMSGLSGLGEAAGSMAQYTGGKTGIETLEEAGKKTNEYFREIGEQYLAPEYLQGSIVDNPALLAKGAWWAYNVANVLPSFAAAMIPAAGTAKGLSLLGKTIKFSSPVLLRLGRIAPSLAGGAAGGTLEGTSTYQEVLAKGGTKDEAESAMELMTLASGALNALSFGQMFQGAPAGFTAALRKYLATGAWEAGTEWAEEPAEGLIKKAMGVATWGDVWKQMKDGVNVMPASFLIGAAGGAASSKSDATAAGVEQKRAILNEILDIEEGVRRRQEQARQKQEDVKTQKQRTAERKTSKQRMVEGMYEGEAESAYIDPAEQVVRLQDLGYPDGEIVKMSGAERRRAAGEGTEYTPKEEPTTEEISAEKTQEDSESGEAGALNEAQRRYMTMPVGTVRKFALNGDNDAKAVLGIRTEKIPEKAPVSAQEKPVVKETLKPEGAEQATAGEEQEIPGVISEAKTLTPKVKESKGEKPPQSPLTPPTAGSSTGGGKGEAGRGKYLTMAMDELRAEAEKGVPEAVRELGKRENDIRKYERLKKSLEKKGILQGAEGQSGKVAEGKQAGTGKQSVEEYLLGKTAAIDGMNFKKLKRREREFISQTQKTAGENGFRIFMDMKTGKARLFQGEKEIKAARSTVTAEAEGAVMMEEIPETTRGKIQAIIEVLGADLDVSGLSKEQIKSAIKDIKIDNGKERSVRAQAVLNELFDSIDQGEIPILTNKGQAGGKREKIQVPVDDVIETASSQSMTFEEFEKQADEIINMPEEKGQTKLLTAQKQQQPARVITRDYREEAAEDKSTNTNLFNTQKFEGEKQTAIPLASGKPVAEKEKSSDIKAMTPTRGAGSKPSGKIPEKPEGGYVKTIESLGKSYLPVSVKVHGNWKEPTRVIIGKRGHIEFSLPSRGGIHGSNVVLRNLIEDAIDREFGIQPEPGVYYRFTNNKDEIKIAKSGELRNSYDYSSQQYHKGVSVLDKPVYGFMGYRYVYKLTGDIIGAGADGEPLLDTETIKPLQTKINKAEYYSDQYNKKRKLVIEKALKRLDWTKEQYNAARNNHWSIPIEGQLFNSKEVKIETQEESFNPRAAKTAVQEVPRSISSKKPMALEGAQWNERLSPEAEIPQKVNKSEIIKYVEKALGVPIRSRVTYRWKSPGMYYPQDWVVRMRKWGELPVLAHEVAHHIDVAIFGKKYGSGWARAFTDKGNRRAIRKELSDLDYDQSKRRTSEGFAEFIRHYLTTGEAQERAPLFHDMFIKKILPDSKGLGKILDNLNRMMNTWQLQGAENRILAQVDFKGEHTFATTFKEKKAKLYRWFQTKWNDEFYPVQQIVRDIEIITGKELPPSKNPAKLLEFGKSKAGMIARTFVMEKAINEKGEPVGPGLAEILEPVGKEKMESFIAYAVARRAQILHAREIESGIDTQDADYIAKKFKSETFDTALDGITAWSDHLLNWVVRAGGLSEEVAALMRELNPIYIPFKRAYMDELRAFRQKELTNKGKPAGSIDESREKRDAGASYVDKGKPVKELKGSGMAIINPIESLISQATEMISKAQKIRIAATIADLAGQEGIAGIITEVPAPIGSASGRMDRKQMLEFLGEMGADIHPHDPAMDRVFTVFFQDTKYKGKENVVAIWRNGERKFYELHHELYRSLAGMDMEQVPPYLHLIAGFSRMLRLGATGLNIAFGLVRNPWRDAQSYVVLSKQKNAKLRDVPRGLYREMKTKEGDLIWRFKALGGSISSMVGYDREATRNVYDELLQEMVGGKKGKVLKVARHPINALRDVISGFWEMAPRSAELEGRYKELREEHPDWTEEDIFIEGFNDGQDVTVNFTKSGQYAKQLNQVAAFFNVAIRGPEKAYRTLRKRPAHSFLQILKYITLPAVALYLVNRKKQWYKNLPPAYKYNNIFFEAGDQIIRLPIPFDIGLVGSAIPLAALDYLETKDPAYIAGLTEIFKGQVPNPTPSVFGPMIDVWRNKNWLDQPIESKAMEGLPVTERTRDYTTGIAKIMSRGANAVGIKYSPVQLDYLFGQYTGGFMRQFGTRKIKELADVPVLSQLLLSMPENPRRQLDKFFGEWERLSQRVRADIASSEEKQRHRRLKSVYGRLTRRHFKRLREFRKEDDRDKIREEYTDMTEMLKDKGFE